MPIIISLIFGIVHGVLDIFGYFSQFKLVKLVIIFTNHIMKQLVNINELISLWKPENFRATLRRVNFTTVISYLSIDELFLVKSEA